MSSITGITPLTVNSYYQGIYHKNNIASGYCFKGNSPLMASNSDSFKGLESVTDYWTEKWQSLKSRQPFVKPKASFMYREISEQPKILHTLVNRYLPLDSQVENLNLNLNQEECRDLAKIFIPSCGSSKNVASIAKYLFEDIAQIPVIIEPASEFAGKINPLSAQDLVIAVSQSGETTDVYSAMDQALKTRARTLSITNNPSSRIHKMAESSMDVGAGKEQSIAATKSFTAQLVNLYALALYLAEQKGTLSDNDILELKKELHAVPAKLNQFIQQADSLDKVAKKLKKYNHIVLLGRGVNSAVAQEGALKIKETNYIDANGYASGEFLHGYMAVLDHRTPVISIIVPSDNQNYEEAIKNTRKIKVERKSPLIIIKSEHDHSIERIPEFKNATFINVPESSEYVSPLLTTVALQLLALKIAVASHKNVDNPRSLSKVVK